MNVLKYTKPFKLESNIVLPEINIAYCTFGTLNKKKNNVIWICHALTANADAADWWSGLVGEGKLIDTSQYFVVCANNLGSCYGATNARSINPMTQNQYGKDFPILTIRDLVQSHDVLRNHLKIKKIGLLIGGSMGGQQIIEWAIMKPKAIENICVLATNARHSAWGIAFNEAQRMSIEADSTLYDVDENAGRKGLEAARAVAMLSYRNYQTYNATQAEKTDDLIDNYRASSYQRYQGYKLWKRFDPLSYITLSKTMDSHNVGRGRGGVEKALQMITAPTLVIGIQTDFLFPISEQKLLADAIPNSRLEVIDSSYGHDGFLIENETISRVVSSFLEGSLKSESENQTFALPGTESF